MPEGKPFWNIRSANYDKLYWAKHSGYLYRVLDVADLKSWHTVLDVGTGTGIVARAAKPHVKHVVALDNSDWMLAQGQWEGFSVVKWDIRESLFLGRMFHRILARMVFHHILNGLDGACDECYRLLKPGGKLIVAEGVPPSDNLTVVDWFTKMFRLKEERKIFLPQDLVSLLKHAGFRNVRYDTYWISDFSVREWLENSGLPKEDRQKVFAMYLEAPHEVREAHAMRFTPSDCLIRAKQVVVTGQK